jgi:hypothetical protein
MQATGPGKPKKRKERRVDIVADPFHLPPFFVLNGDVNEWNFQEFCLHDRKSNRADLRRIRIRVIHKRVRVIYSVGNLGILE